jgi:hypothetical protein
MAKRRSALVQPVDPINAADMSMDAIAAEARLLWTKVDDLVDKRVRVKGKPGQTLLALQLVLHRLRGKSRASLMEMGMSIAQLETFDEVNALADAKPLIQPVAGRLSLRAETH